MTHNHIAILGIDLDHFELHGLVNINVIIPDRLNIDLRPWQKRLDAKHIDDHTALGATLHIALDDLVVIHGLIDAIPALQLASLLVRQYQLPALVLGVLDKHFHLLTHSQLRIIPELRNRNDPFRLVPDVDGSLPLVQPDNRPLDNLALDYIRQGLVILLLDRFF